MKSLVRILRAASLAALVHRKQRDKGGKPYLRHVVRVAWLAYGLTGKADAVVVGLLHDVLEDGGVGAELRLRREFDDVTFVRVRRLTRRFGMHYDDYVGWIGDSDDIVVAVKIADLLHNTQPGRLPYSVTGGPKHQSRAGRYARALALLTANRARRSVE